MTLTEIQTVTNIVQNLTLVGATLVAAWWAYVTFGLKEKTDELLAIARKVVEIHSHIDGSVSTYNLYKILTDLGSFDKQKLTGVKQAAEARLVALREELNQLQELSLRIPVAFRILTLSEYQLVLIDLTLSGGIERWGEKDIKDKLSKAKFEILNKIYADINKHGSFIRKIQIKVQNTLFRIKGVRDAVKE